MDKCERCNGTGMVAPPPCGHIPAPLYVARAAQAAAGRITFCTCDKGQAYRQYLRAKYAAIQAGTDSVPDWQNVKDIAGTDYVERRIL